MSSFDQVEKHDALCILPLNIVNEKIYIFLWFWLLLLGCLSTLVVAYRLGQMSCKVLPWKIELYAFGCLFFMIKNWQASSFSYCPVSKDASLPALYKVGLFSSEAKKVSREREQIIGFLLDNNNTWPMIPGPWTTREKKLFLKHISSPRFRLIKREVVNTLVKKSKMGDWFLFYMLGQNVDSMIFKEVRMLIVCMLIVWYSKR